MIRTTLAALALALSPTLALAMGCSEHTVRTSTTCPEGQVWDATGQTCTKPVTG
jgi:hypothetical protein